MTEDESRNKANKKKYKKKEKDRDKEMRKEKGSSTAFHINDHRDVLVEVLTRLDARSLALAACVCRLWSGICRHDTLWENLCNRHVSSPSTPYHVRPVVVALGGYRRLYTACVGPALERLRDRDEARRLSLSLSLSLSLFSIDCYERQGGRRRGEASSLMFLCPPLNVS
ncbi:F-box protein SNE-like [Aristolochia californica]|uniref:F-box protein SNE-like n=1 Tax=Aristolochia californica TaxID=171875 RepID=UPI0035D5F0E5